MSDERRSLIDDLRIPTNPDHDWDADPDGQMEYANPVTLSNLLVRYANAALVVTRRIVTANRALGRLKAGLVEKRNDLADLDHELLSKYPPPASAKALKLIDAHLRRVAEESGYGDARKALARELRKLEAGQAVAELNRDSARQVLAGIELAGEHIKTHLAFVKSEYVRSGRYT